MGRGIVVHWFFVSDGHHWYHWYVLGFGSVFGLWLMVAHWFVVLVLVSMEGQHMSVLLHVVTMHW